METRHATFTLILEIEDPHAVWDAAFNYMVAAVGARVIPEIIGSRGQIEVGRALAASLEHLAEAKYPGLKVLDYECKVEVQC